MINESKLNNRMLHLMESGFFGKQLLNESLNIDKNFKVRIFQTFYNYWGHQGEWILVDGIPGTNTAGAINKLKSSDAWKNEFANTLKDGLNDYYNHHLNGIKKEYLSDLKGGGLNNIHNLRVLQAILCLSGNTEVKPDGVMGPITRTAMKEKLGTDNAAKITDEKLKAVIDEAIKNVGATDMSFKIAGVEGAAGSDAKPDSGAKKPDAGAGETSDADNQRLEFLAGLDKIKNLAKTFYIKLGAFKVNNIPGQIPEIRFYDYNPITGKEQFIGEAKYPTSEFIEKAKEKGFSEKGCWTYFNNTGEIHLYKCSSAFAALGNGYDVSLISANYFKNNAYSY